MTSESGIEYVYNLKGVYLDAYNAVVRPESVFAIQTYTIRRWAPILGATAFWLLVALQQETYRNPGGNDWCVVSRPRLAKAAAMSEATVHRYLHDKPYTQSLLCRWVRVPSAETVRHRPRYRSRDGKLVQPPNRYTVAMDAPLAPVDQRGLAQFLLERGARAGAPAEVVIPALRDLSAWRLNDLLDLCDEHAERFTPPENWREEGFHPTVADVVRALGVQTPAEERERTQFLSLCSDVQNAFVRQRYLGTQYFLRQWLPVLDHKLALIVVHLRSMCFHDAETRRDVVASLTFGELARAVGCSARWLQSINDTRPESKLFFLVERPGRGNTPVFRVNLLDPIASGDRERYEQLLHQENGTDELLIRISSSGDYVKNGTGVSENGTGELLIAGVDTGVGEPVTTNVAGSEDEAGMDEASATKSDRVEALERDAEGPEEPPGEKGTGELLIAKNGTDELLRTELVNCSSGKNGTGELLRTEPVNRENGTGEQHISTISTYISTSGRKALRQQHARASAAALLLEDFGIGPPASSQILARNPGDDHIRAWMLYALTQPGLDDPGRAAGYVVNRLLTAEPPPPRFLDWARLARSDWRDLWRAAEYGGDYAAALRPDLARVFDQWRSDFAGVFPDGPFGDEQIDAASICRIIAELDGDPAMFEIQAQGGGVVIVKPTTNSARDWLRRTEGALRAALQQRGIYHRLRVVEEDEPAANIAPDPELARLWHAALEDLSTRLARSTFDGLLLGSQMVELSDTGCVIAVRSEYAQAWAQARLEHRVRDVLAALLGRRVAVAFTSGPGASRTSRDVDRA